MATASDLETKAKYHSASALTLGLDLFTQIEPKLNLLSGS